MDVRKNNAIGLFFHILEAGKKGGKLTESKSRSPATQQWEGFVKLLLDKVQVMSSNEVKVLRSSCWGAVLYLSRVFLEKLLHLLNCISRKAEVKVWLSSFYSYCSHIWLVISVLLLQIQVLWPELFQKGSTKVDILQLFFCTSTLLFYSLGAKIMSTYGEEKLSFYAKGMLTNQPEW